MLGRCHRFPWMQERSEPLAWWQRADGVGSTELRHLELRGLAAVIRNRLLGAAAHRALPHIAYRARPALTAWAWRS